jgi:hypothetical protein
MQDTTGTLWLYTYNPAIGFFSGQDVGKVGSNVNFIGCANLVGDGDTRMVMQEKSNGTLWLYTYDPNINALSGISVGAVGLEWHAVGFGPLGFVGQDEMLMQNAAGSFEAYRYDPTIHGFSGTAMGTVGPPWTVGGIAPNNGGAAGSSNALLVQAIATFGGGSAGDTLSTAPLGADRPQHTFLTTPQHA